MASKNNNALQSADQAVFGTAVTPPTEVLSDIRDFKLNIDWSQARTKKAMDGMLTPGSDSVVGYHTATATSQITEPSYEGVNAVFDSLFGKVTPTGTMPKVREYAAPLATVPTPLLRTLLYGENVSGGTVLQMNDASVSSIKISGEDAGAPQIDVDWIGSKALSASALAILALRTGDIGILGCHANSGLFVDDWTGTIGTTALANAAYSYTREVQSNRAYRGFLGDCSPTKGTDAAWEGSLTLSVEVTPTTKAFLTAMLPNNALKKQIRILYSVGTGSAKRSLQIDFAGHCITPPSLFDERLNQNAFDLKFSGVYNPTFGNWLKIKTESGLA